MLDKKDAQWWILEAQKHPETAVDLIRTLAERLHFLDRQNEELRADLIALRRKGTSGDTTSQIETLQQRIQALEAALNSTATDRIALIYASNRIEANRAMTPLKQSGLGRPLATDARLLVARAGSSLLIVTAEARAFHVALGALPAPKEAAMTLGNPNDIAAILDAAAVEASRFLTLLTQRGFVYSVLAGNVLPAAKKGDSILRNRIPDDPIIAATASYNADLVVISKKGRWIRFPEKAIAGVGSAALELAAGDLAVGIIGLRNEAQVSFLAEDGRIFVRPSAELTARRAPGATGSILVKGVTLLAVTAAEHFAVTTTQGRVLTVSVADLPHKAHTESGAGLPMALNENEFPVALAAL